jgi:type VI protein secretion system component VasK
MNNQRDRDDFLLWSILVGVTFVIVVAGFVWIYSPIIGGANIIQICRERPDLLLIAAAVGMAVAFGVLFILAIGRAAMRLAFDRKQKLGDSDPRPTIAPRPRH